MGGGPNSFNFMQFLEKFSKKHVLAPSSPEELVPPPPGIPRCTTGRCIHAFRAGNFWKEYHAQLN